jgi:hypothetical protein
VKLQALLAFVAALAFTVDAQAEEDPFAAEYAPPRPVTIGTSAGQFRIFGGGGGFIGHGIGLAGQGTLELMTLPWIGVRSSSMLTIPFDHDPQLWAFRLGPSLHVLPYHRVDLSIFSEGGFSLVDITRSGKRTIMPVIAGGGSFDIFATTFLVIRMEGLLQIGIADRHGKAEEVINPVGLVGLGLAL